MVVGTALDDGDINDKHERPQSQLGELDRVEKRERALELALSLAQIRMGILQTPEDAADVLRDARSFYAYMTGEGQEEEGA